MGSFGKQLGRIAARSLESESTQIIQRSRANKVEGSLGKLFDTTLKESHDMRIFGMGTLSSMASTERYGRFTTSMHGVYSTMELELDRCSKDSPNGKFWEQHQDVLRRTQALVKDLQDAKIIATSDVAAIPPYSDATRRYVQSIENAGRSDRETGGVRLLGHAYCRYLADLMGGQMLGAPTRMALALPQAPTHYNFDWEKAGFETRRDYVESIYEGLNQAGDAITEAQKEEGLVEARLAFAMNIDVYSEEPLWAESVVGIANVVSGFVQRR